ncbi:MAG: Rv3235 family protein, partial [Acidimicrobiales bacterium]
MSTPSPATVRDPAPRAQEQPTPPAAPSTGQVEAIVRHIAQTYLEVERGLRPPQHLEPHLTSDAYNRLRRRPRQSFARGGPVGPRDLGPISSTTYSDAGRVFASLTAREQDDRWSGLLLQLQRLETGRLVVAELQRVPPRPQARLPEPRRERSLDERIQWVEEERDLVEAALLAEREHPLTGRGDHLWAPDPVGPAATHASRIAELDHELAMLHAQGQGRQAVEAHAHVIEPAQPDYITKLIGPRPPEGWSRLQWDSAHDAIEDYRRRHDITDDTALGPPSANARQQNARNDAIRVLRRTQSILRTSREGPWIDHEARFVSGPAKPPS